ncbi:MAG: thioredoxin domain-containing protein [Rhizobiaceae bacterium]|nr:thioredoxin domain-containing protein [Rhizobiaceae bacterium]
MPLPAANLLADETSPYLRQHADNPVHWRSWSQAALAEAAELDRPILLSIGYAACHWCHVMAHESFEDADVAAVMNRLFVNIKVDREERPEIDQIYMAALAAMGEQGGWPLTMFLTPDARPFWGGTYFPKQQRFGRPGFVDVLNSVNRAWVEQKDKINHSAGALRGHVEQRLAPAADRADITASRLTDLASGILGIMDMQAGGLRGAPKFPNAPFMKTLWLAWLDTGDTAYRDAVLHALRTMLNGGIYDHVGGGLCRYSTDASWLVPHFEKMLYDNAQLIRLCTWAHGETAERLFQVRIEETIDWLSRELLIDGAFASSLDADSDGEEGLFYTWDHAEVSSALGAEAPAFFDSYLLSGAGHWEGKPILHARPGFSGAPAGSELRASLDRLRQTRENRIRPGRDDKILVDWNGLAIEAIADAARHFSRPDWLATAVRAFRFISESTDTGGRLPHSLLADRKLFPAMSSDYAAMINAAIALHSATGDGTYVDAGLALLDRLDRWYTDAGGHYLSASDAADVPIRIRGDVDEAIPSATGQIVEAVSRLAIVTGRPDLQRRAWDLAELAAGRAAGQAYGQAGIVNACATVLAQRKLVVVGPSESELVSVANRVLDPRRVDRIVAPGTASEPLPGGVPVDTGHPGAWLCTANTCLPPIHDPETLAAALRPPRTTS